MRCSNTILNFARVIAPEKNGIPGRLGCWLLLLTVAIQVGCFDAEVIIASRRAIAIRARLEEVDLGEYRVTLPQFTEHSDPAQLDFHIFGQVANRELKAVKKALEDYGPEIHHQLILEARSLSEQELEDPELTSLREDIAKVVNETLDGDPVQLIGFYKFSYSSF